MAPTSPLSSKMVEEILSQVEDQVRIFIYSKIRKKLIEFLDISMDVDYNQDFVINVDIELNVGPLSSKYQAVVEDAVELAHNLLEEKLRR